jgi:hypothetical protein
MTPILSKASSEGAATRSFGFNIGKKETSIGQLHRRARGIAQHASCTAARFLFWVLLINAVREESSLGRDIQLAEAAVLKLEARTRL